MVCFEKEKLVPGVIYASILLAVISNAYIINQGYFRADAMTKSENNYLNRLVARIEEYDEYSDDDYVDDEYQDEYEEDYSDDGSIYNEDDDIETKLKKAVAAEIKKSENTKKKNSSSKSSCSFHSNHICNLSSSIEKQPE